VVPAAGGHNDLCSGRRRQSGHTIDSPQAGPLQQGLISAHPGAPSTGQDNRPEDHDPFCGGLEIAGKPTPQTDLAKVGKE
jgi:hypothetical protein